METKEFNLTLQILGTGCTKCNLLEAEAHKAAEELGGSVSVEKITDLDLIQDMGVMMTPALAVDGEVKSTGKVLNKDQILELVRGGFHGLHRPT